MLTFNLYLLPENCYKRIETETKAIKDEIVKKLSNTPIDKEVVVLYEGENLPEQVLNRIKM